MRYLTAAEFKPHVARVVSELGAPYTEVNVDAFAAFFEPAIDSGIGRAYANEKGFLCALFITDPLTGDFSAVQQLWMQSTGNGLELFRAFERDAKAAGCARILSGCIVNRERMGKLYRRLGYEAFSENFQKKL